jgi:hypothetical protein
MPFPKVSRGARDSGAKEGHDAASTHAPHGGDAGPLHRQSAQLAPPLASPVQTLASPMTPSHDEAPAVRARASFEEVLPQIVRRIAWSGDARRGAVRMELGAGALAGATLLIECEDGRVHVRLSAPLGVDADAWRARIAARLAAKRIAVEAIHVD